MQKKKVYGKETSQRIYELARLFRLGYEVFDSKEDFKNWLMTPSRALGNKIPFELLGFYMVFAIVGAVFTLLFFFKYNFAYLPIHQHPFGIYTVYCFCMCISSNVRTGLALFCTGALAI